MSKRIGIGWIWIGVTLLAAPAAATVAARGADVSQREQQRAAEVTEERMVELDEMRAAFFERLGELLAGGWLDVRGTIEPAEDGKGELATAASSMCDGVRGTIEPPPGCN